MSTFNTLEELFVSVEQAEIDALSRLLTQQAAMADDVASIKATQLAIQAYLGMVPPAALSTADAAALDGVQKASQALAQQAEAISTFPPTIKEPT